MKTGSFERDAASKPISGEEFDRLVEACGPASLILVIESRLGAPLRQRVSAEDVLQESLLLAWRDRERARLDGSVRGFRLWLLAIIQHRICDLADHELAQKRGGGTTIVSLGVGERLSGAQFGPLKSTTPSRIAIFREQAAAMREAMRGMPEDLVEIVRLRLFEQVTVEEIAARLGLGESAVRYRFRRGMEIYERRLVTQYGVHSRTSDASPPDFAAPPSPHSSS